MDHKRHEKCSRMLSLQEFKKGERIFNQGETGAPYFYIILKGTVSITQSRLVKDSHGELVPQEEILAFLKLGQAFGELAIISHAPRSPSFLFGPSPPLFYIYYTLCELFFHYAGLLMRSRPQIVVVLFYLEWTTSFFSARSKKKLILRKLIFFPKLPFFLTAIDVKFS